MGGCSAATTATITVIIAILLIGLATCGSSTSTDVAYLACSSSSPSAGAHSCRALSEDAAYYSAVALLAMNNVSGITSIPAKLTVPAGNYTIAAAFRAVGHQHYTFNGTAWAVSNASAFLYDSAANSTEAGGVIVGKHFFLAEVDANGGQPSWQVSGSGGFSRVTAKGVASKTVDADSIAWNLLQATSHVAIISESTSSTSSSASDDVAWVGDVSFVQRLDTQRGLPPSTTSAATASATLGSTYASVYSALYAFYIPTIAHV